MEKMSDEELIEKVLNNQERKKAIETLYNRYQRAFRKIAYKYPLAEQEEILQEMYFALNNAIETYDKNKSASFFSYLYLICKRFAFRYHNKNIGISIPEYIIFQIMQYKKIESDYKTKYGKAPTEQYIRHKLKLSADSFRELKETMKIADVTSGNDFVPGTNKEKFDLIQNDRDDIQDAIDKVQNEQLSILLWSCVDTLTEEEQKTIKAKYIEGKTIKDIADENGISYNKARNIEQRAIKTIKKHYNCELLSFLDNEKAFSLGLRRVGVDEFHRTSTSATEYAVLYAEEQTNRQIKRELHKF